MHKMTENNGYHKHLSDTLNAGLLPGRHKLDGGAMKRCKGNITPDAENDDSSLTVQKENSQILFIQ